MSELLKKYESIDQSKLNEATIKILDRVKTITADFTTEDKKNNEIAEQVLDGIMQKNPDAVKIVKREPKAKPAPKKIHKATHTNKAKKTAKAKQTTISTAKYSNNIMSVAKEIQKAGESWKDAMERAKVVLKERKEKVLQKQKTELEKLYALVKTKKELQGFTKSDIQRDAVRDAKPRGARVVTKEGSTSNAYGTFPNKIGRKYWETRDRHADRLAPNYPKNMPLLASGGSVTDAPFSVEVFKTKLRFDNELPSSSKGDFTTFAKAKEFAIEMIDNGNYYAYINSKNGYLWGVSSNGVESFANGGGIDGGMTNLTIQDVSFSNGGEIESGKIWNLLSNEQKLNFITKNKPEIEKNLKLNQEIIFKSTKSNNWDKLDENIKNVFKKHSENKNYYFENIGKKVTWENYRGEKIKGKINGVDFDGNYYVVDDDEYGYNNAWLSPDEVKFRDTSKKKFWLFSDGGGVGQKKYNTQYNVGKAKYVVNYYDGIKNHKDGSNFYDIAIFKNKKDFEAFLTKLSKDGYREMGYNSSFEKGGIFYKEGSNKYGLGNTEIFVQEENHMYCVYDNVYNNENESWEIKRIADFDNMDEAKEFAIEYSKKEYADGGSLPFMTDPNFGNFQKTVLENGGSMAHGKGYRNDYVYAKEFFEEDGLGETYVKNGSFDAELFKTKMLERTSNRNARIEAVIKIWARNLGMNTSKYIDGEIIEDVEFAKDSTERAKKLFEIHKSSFELGGAFMMTDLAGHSGGGTGGLNADMPLSGTSGTYYTGLVGETGAMSSGELFMDGGAMAQNQQVINDASQPYVITESFGNPAQQIGMLAKGGSIKNQYEGRTPEDIWNNLSKQQRGHFIYDHVSEIEEYKNIERLPSSEIIKAYNSEWSSLDKDIKNRFYNHTREGQYAYGGKTKSRQSMRELYIEQIAMLTNTRTVGVDAFAKEHNLSDSELSNLMTGLGRKMISQSDFVTALVGDKGNPKQKEVVAFAKSDKAYKMADGGSFAPNVSDGTQFMNGVYADGGDVLPPSKTYGENIYKAMQKFNISDSEARKRYGQYTISQWSELLREKMADGGGIRSQEELNKIISEKDEKVKGLTPKQVAEMWNENSWGVKEGVSKPITVEEAKNPIMKMYLRNLLIENELTEDEYSEYFADGGFTPDVSDGTQFMSGVYANGGKLKKYIDHDDIKSVSFNVKGNIIKVSGDSVLNGANMFEDGGDLTKIANYIPKRNVVEVELKDGSKIKPVNGYWLKKDWKTTSAKAGYIKDSNEGSGNEDFKIGDFVKKTEKQGSITYGTQGFIYEINQDFSEIKLEDDYGNKNPKWFKLKGFRKLKSKSKDANIGSNTTAITKIEQKESFADGGLLSSSQIEKLDSGFTIPQLNNMLEEMFPYSFRFEVFKQMPTSMGTRDRLYYDYDNMVKDDKLKLYFHLENYGRDLNYEVYQGQENTYFKFLLMDDNIDTYVGTFGFKDNGDVDASYITKFVSFLQDAFHYPLQVRHSVMENGGSFAPNVSDGTAFMDNAYFADGGGVSGYDNSSYQKLHAEIKSRVVRAIGIDSAIDFYDAEYPIRPYQLLEKAVRKGFITLDEINERVVDSAMETAQDSEDMDEIGSSDETYFMQEFLDEAGFKTVFVEGRLLRVYADGGNLMEVHNGTAFMDNPIYADSGLMIDDNDGFMKVDNNRNFRYPEMEVKVETLDEPIDLTDNVSYAYNEVTIIPLNDEIDLKESNNMRVGKPYVPKNRTPEKMMAVNPRMIVTDMPMPTSNTHKND